MLLTKATSRRRKLLSSPLSANMRGYPIDQILYEFSLSILLFWVLFVAHPPLGKSNDADPSTYFSSLSACYRTRACRKDFSSIIYFYASEKKFDNNYIREEEEEEEKEEELIVRTLLYV